MLLFSFNDKCGHKPVAYQVFKKLIGAYLKKIFAKFTTNLKQITDKYHFTVIV